MPKHMLINDLKKGDVVYLTGTGWKATLMDKKKGGIRKFLNVEGIETEMGDVYIDEIDYAIINDEVFELDMTPRQVKKMKKTRDAIKKMGF